MEVSIKPLFLVEVSISKEFQHRKSSMKDVFIEEMLTSPNKLLFWLCMGSVGLFGSLIYGAENLSPSRKPGQNFNLKGFKLQLPVERGNGVEEVLFPALSTYSSDYFYTDNKTGAMVFWVPTDGAHTSGSKYPRTELRDTKDFTISTATTSLAVTLAVLQTPQRNNIVVGQLKGESDQPIELRWIEGSVVASVKTAYKQAGVENLKIVSGLKEGAKFSYSMAVEHGLVVIKVNDVEKKLNFDKSWDADKVYWKFGNYCQDNSKSPNNAAKVAVFAFTLK
jgi:hypothetical protein